MTVRKWRSLSRDLNHAPARRGESGDGEARDRSLVVHDTANVTYLCTGIPTVIPQALVVSMKKDEPIFILRKMDAPAKCSQSRASYSKSDAACR
ncbi:hypothetical protein SAMN05216338_10668 [Bradyrhizobium sp. Rc2d]|uniref:hypothetical protein n=1 Tax=Bradyrhizobium sp. Rc2d TaxID=1855321 RepID=UPI000891A593|nr:hypothetical protein [Bradyrhizobium sp. Rc2d]SDJ79387.1 hypothetical protein SAMN05216338_10668 [Bradyrhizobium sp. Rc2d]